MSDSRKEGIDKLKKAKISLQNLTKEELQETYASLVEENFPDSKRIHFIADLGRSPEIAFHFELICNDWEEETDLNVEASFDQHGQAGIDYLLETLNQEEVESQRVLIVYSHLVLKKHSKHSKIFGTSLNKSVTFFFKTAQACSMGFKSGE